MSGKAVRASLLALAAGGIGFAIARTGLESRLAQVDSLQQRTQVLEAALLRKQNEVRKVEALAEERYRALRDELHKSQADQAQLWEILGQAEKRPRSSLASRGRGVQGRFREIDRQVTAHRGQLQQLRLATLLYRQKKAEEERLHRLRHTPSGPPCRGEMTSPFGPRYHPIYGGGRLHRGCDYTTPEGTVIEATADGVVLTSDWLGGYGKVVEIDHGLGFKTLYAHCDQLRVSKGQRVVRGQAIATVGMTGLTSGPHCHYEVHLHGQAVDPAPYLPPAEPPTAKARWWNWLGSLCGSF